MDKIKLVKDAVEGKLTNMDILRLEKKGVVKVYTVRRCRGYVSRKAKLYPVFIAKPRGASRFMLCFKAPDANSTQYQFKVYYDITSTTF